MQCIDVSKPAGQSPAEWAAVQLGVSKMMGTNAPADITTITEAQVQTAMRDFLCNVIHGAQRAAGGDNTPVTDFS